MSCYHANIVLAQRPPALCPSTCPGLGISYEYNRPFCFLHGHTLHTLPNGAVRLSNCPKKERSYGKADE